VKIHGGPGHRPGGGHRVRVDRRGLLGNGIVPVATLPGTEGA